MASLVTDELERVVSTLCAKFPGRSLEEIDALVSETYRHLAADARVTTHLIPLTVNLSRQELSRTPVPAAAPGLPR
jgi:hypothetical protein